MVIVNAMTTLRLRRDLDALPSRRSGTTPPRGGGPPHKLSSNENPFPPLPSVTAKISELLPAVNRYPQPAAMELTARISRRFGVSASRVVFGSGSVEVVSQLIRATADPASQVIFPWPSFEAYPLLTAAAGAVGVPVPLDARYRHDFAAMRTAVSAQTSLVIVCNPNNPTGTAVCAADLEDFISAIPPHIVVLIDEAYLQFNRDPASPAGIDLARRYRSVVVAHTFSKAYGLAGLRIGYAVAPEQVAAAMRKVAVPYGVTALAQAAALASLDAEDELAQRVEWLVAERHRVGMRLRGLGWRLPDSQANFFWFPLGTHTDAAADVFGQHGIAARRFDGEGLRVSLGDTAANDALIAVAAHLAPEFLPS
jgi:histidinol-phosphate aminotransferase